MRSLKHPHIHVTIITYLMALAAIMPAVTRALDDVPARYQTVSSDDLKRLGITVRSYELEIRRPFNCGPDQEPEFDQFDPNRDGVLERGPCIGVEYDPCVQGSVAIAYHEYQAQGNVCVPYCDGFGPFPDFCTGR